MERGVERFTAEEAEEYLNRIPKFTKKKHSIEELREILDETGLSLDGIRLIHVAGTNGKGSVCAFLSSILRETGEHTAVFTSPHLVSARERFSFDGKQVEKEEFLSAFQVIQNLLPVMEERRFGHPSYFEYLFLMFAAMMQERREFTAVVETGLGGRLDATNAVRRPDLCVITSISLDHMEYLGDTVEQIAGEKAGIIKPGIPVVYDRTDEAAAAVIERQARLLKSPAFGVEEDNSWQQTLEQGHLFLRQGGRVLEIPFAAPYQAVNAMLAVRAAAELGISWQTASRGVKKASWPGRMEEIAPGVYLDGAHNEGGIRAFARAASQLPGKRKILLFAVASDKEYQTMLRLLFEMLRPDAVVLTRIAGSRGLDVEILRAKAEAAADEAGLSIPMTVRPLAEEAFFAALQDKGEEDAVFCAGSLYLAGEIKDVIRRNCRDERR